MGVKVWSTPSRFGADLMKRGNAALPSLKITASETFEFMATPETREAIVFVHVEPTQEFGAFLCG